MAILRHTAKSACLMIFILAVAVVVILIIGFVLLSMRGKYGELEDPSIASPYVQDVIPVQQEPAFWYLSPAGDKILYNTSSSQSQPQAIVRTLSTGQEIPIADCARFRWLDNARVYCYGLMYDDDYEPFVATSAISTNAESIQRSMIKKLNVEQIETETFLKQAKTIYKLDALSEPDSLLIETAYGDNAGQYHHILGIENLDQTLKNNIYITVPLYDRDAEPSKKVYSPDRKYYYHYILQESLEIYDAASDKLLAELKLPSKQGAFLQIGGHLPNATEGWAADDSGVYFRNRYSGGFFGPPPPIQPIQKLCVPGSPGCPSTN